MRTSSVVAILVIIIIILAGGWYWLSHYSPGMGSYYPSAYQTTGVTSSSTGVTASTTGGAYNIGSNLALGENSSAMLGTYVVGFNGMTLYVYAKDSVGTSTCYGQCAVAWPPYTVTSTANLVAEAPLSGAVGTITRADGTTQLTYKGLPLYFYQGDTAPEQTNGQGVGGVWSVAQP